KLLDGIAGGVGELGGRFGWQPQALLIEWLLVTAPNGVEQRLAFDLLVEEKNTVQQSFRTWRAAGDVDVDRHDRVDALHHRVVVENTAGRSAGAHRDHPLGLRHLIVDAAEHRRELEPEPADATQEA